MRSAADIGELIDRLEDLKGGLGGGGGRGEKGNPLQRPRAEPLRTATTSPRPAPGSSDLSAPEEPGKPGKETVAPAAHTDIPPGHISADEVAARWPEVVSGVRTKRPALASVLESSAVLGIQGTTVRIGCANEFEAASITRHKDLLSETLSKVLNTRLRVEVEIRRDLHTPPPSAKDGSPAAAQGLDNEHPVIKALKKELGAEPL